MHPSCYQWVQALVDTLQLAGKATLEVGSQNVNGTVRDFFHGPYIGCDIAPARGVDVVADATDLSMFRDNEWETVISTEMLEHCPRPWLAFDEMARVCEPGGVVIVTARGYDHRGCWEVHGYPYDYYRYSDRALQTLAADAGIKVEELTADPEGPGWFMWGRKR